MRIPSLAAIKSRLTRPFDAMSPTARRDLLLIGAAGAIAFMYGASLDLFDTLHAFLVRYEYFEADELILAAITASACLVAFSMRRMRETADAMKKQLLLEQHAKAMAAHDALTGLPNRRRLKADLDIALTEAASGAFIAVVSIDLDRFKPINDLYGHAAGDELLVGIAQALGEHAGNTGTVARLGGDEFVLVWRDILDEDDLLTRLSQLQLTLQKPMQIAGTVVSVGASMGVASVRGELVSTPEAMRRADIALLRAKQDGRNRFAFFDDAMGVVADGRAAAERELRTAIAEQRIEPFFQPLVDLRTGRTYGYEVLARMRREDGSIQSPEKFIPIAEEMGAIDQLTLDLMRRAFITARDWPMGPLLSVNISPVQLRDDTLAQKILQVLMETGFPAARLQVEITESALVADLAQARAILTSLRNQGVRIALDDFGTGYSSLRHLRELPFDNLKIDRSFVQAMETEPESHTIVHTILDLAKNLGLAVTAEGIEHEINVTRLRELGCQSGQGFLFGRPCEASGVVQPMLDEPEPAVVEPKAGAGPHKESNVA